MRFLEVKPEIFRTFLEKFWKAIFRDSMALVGFLLAPLLSAKSTELCSARKGMLDYG